MSAAALRTYGGAFFARLAPAAPLDPAKAYEVVTYLTTGSNPAVEHTPPVTLAGQADITLDPEDTTVTSGRWRPSPRTPSARRREVSSNDGDTWNVVAGATAKTLTVPTTYGLDGNRYRYVAVATGRRATSAAATLTVEPAAPAITTAPPTRPPCPVAARCSR